VLFYQLLRFYLYAAGLQSVKISTNYRLNVNVHSMYIRYAIYQEHFNTPDYSSVVRVVHLFSFVCCRIMCIYVLSSEV
jgi:hypothetical protein